MINIKTISSLDKIFLKQDVTNIKEINKIKAFKGERISYQIVLKTDDYKKYDLEYKVESKLENIKFSKIGFVPSECPVYEQKLDEYYLTTEPGLFPDILYPLEINDTITIYEYTNTIIWITIDIPKNKEKGTYHVCIYFSNEKEKIYEKAEIEIEITNFALPENDLIYSQWFHTDCISSYYCVDIFSDEHWKLIDSFMEVAARTGINTILTPIITPPLDTEVGKERPTVQLVDIEIKDGKYLFSYDKLEKWVNMAKKYGINRFEMAHLFTQWGAEATPKIIVKENGKNIKKFGWNVNAKSKEYEEFLNSFLPSLIQELKKLNIEKNTYFHISDEPSEKREKDFENYTYAKALVNKYLKNFKIIDALSNIEFYKKGLIEYPIPATNKIEPFLKEDLPERWCYYCCSQAKDVSNRFMAMPSYRTRILGIQLYLFDIVGFIHWGFNFYYSELSKEKIDPFRTTDAKLAFPSGDPFSVYPGKDGAIESIRSVVFYQGLQDRMMLKLLETKIGKEEVKNMVCNLANQSISFKEYPHNQEFLIQLKYKVIEKLENIIREE